MPAVTISHVKTLNATNDWSGAVTVANSTGGATSSQATDLVRPSDWNSAHLFTISQSVSDINSLFSFSSGITSSTNSTGMTIGMQPMSFFEPFPLPNTNSTLANVTVGSWDFTPVFLQNGMGPGRINLFMTRNTQQFLNGVSFSYNTTGSCSLVASFRNMIAFYTYDSANSRLSSIWTGENAESATRTMQFSSTAANSTNVGITGGLTYGFITQINTAGAWTSSQYTFSGTTNQSSSSCASSIVDRVIQSSSASSNSGFFTGSMMIPIPFNTSLPPGNYWMAHAFTTHVSGSTGGVNFTSAHTMFNTSSINYLYLLENVLTGFKLQGKSTVGNSSSCPVLMHGLNTVAASSNATASIGTAGVVAIANRIYWNFVQDQMG